MKDLSDGHACIPLLPPCQGSSEANLAPPCFARSAATGTGAALSAPTPPHRAVAPHLPRRCASPQVGIRLSPFGGFLSASDSHPYAVTTYLLEELNKWVLCRGVDPAHPLLCVNPLTYKTR